MSVEVSGVFWTPFPGHHKNLKCFPHSWEKQWWRGEKSAVFSGYSCLTSSHSQSTMFCSGLQGAVKSDTPPPPPPSLDQARFIFSWLVLFSRCPYYLRALHRPVNKTLMFLKNTQGCTHYRVRQNASQSGVPVALRQKFSSYHGRLQISRPY